MTTLLTYLEFAANTPHWPTPVGRERSQTHVGQSPRAKNKVERDGERIWQVRYDPLSDFLPNLSTLFTKRNIYL